MITQEKRNSGKEQNSVQSFEEVYLSFKLSTDLVIPAILCNQIEVFSKIKYVAISKPVLL